VIYFSHKIKQQQISSQIFNEMLQVRQRSINIRYYVLYDMVHFILLFYIWFKIL